jgi:hypothetical protein
MDGSSDIVFIGGFGISGSGAALDLLCEFKDYKVFVDRDFEVRLFSDPDGLFMLESELLDNWDPYRADVAIKRFRRLIKGLGQTHSSPYFGQNFNKRLSSNFTEISEKYIESLIECSFTGKYFFIENALKYYARKINYHINSLLPNFCHFNFYRKFYGSIYIPCTGEEFIEKTKRYIDDLFHLDINIQKTDKIIVRSAFQSFHNEKIYKYFDNASVVSVWRDPRDVYANAANCRMDFIPLNVNAYIKWFLSITNVRNSFTLDKRSIIIRFEDLVYKYDETLEQIKKVLNLSDGQHLTPKSLFNPESSKRNVGIWKEFKNQDAIARISDNLSEFCFEKPE